MPNPNLTRRRFVQQALGLGAISAFLADSAAAGSLHCTPASRFAVPLTAGIWRSAPFPVGKHDYHVWLEFDSSPAPEALERNLEPPRSQQAIDAPPVLDIEWKAWDGNRQVQNWQAKLFGRPKHGPVEDSYFLGAFEGKRSGMFTIEWNVKRDGERLKDLHPRVYIVKNPGYWCWL